MLRYKLNKTGFSYIFLKLSNFEADINLVLKITLIFGYKTTKTVFNVHTLFIGRKTIHLPSCQSTNDIAISLLENPDILEGTVIITDHQTAGKGQQGAHWEAAPYQNITISVVLCPTFLTANNQFCLNLAISLGIFHFLTSYLGNLVKIKWPNDLYYENKKICGILIQNYVKGNFISKSVVGIGINVNQVQFENPSATSMKLVTGIHYALPELVASLYQFIEVAYIKLKKGDEEALRIAYTNCLFGFGEKRSFKNFETNDFFEGEIIGFDQIGRLKIKTNDTILVFNHKEVGFIF